MKQHMLTHKIRDMPQHMFENSMQSSSLEGNSGNSFSINCQMGKDKQIDDADNGNSVNSVSNEEQQSLQKDYDENATKRYSPGEQDSSLSSADDNNEPVIKKLSKFC